MGTNFYFFRELSAEEAAAVETVRGLSSTPEDWRPPVPFAVPEEIRKLTEKLEVFIRNRTRYQDELFAPKSRGDWDRGKNYFKYWRSSEDYANHIGKRSAAGTYCWDCRRTLCPEGEAAIHYTHSPFYEKCPKCGKGRAPETLENSSAGVELGFAKPHSEVPTGVRSVSSFSWALAEDAFRSWASSHMDEVCIRDEYGEKFSVGQFLQMLDSNCPIFFHENIGVEFS